MGLRLKNPLMHAKLEDPPLPYRYVGSMFCRGNRLHWGVKLLKSGRFRRPRADVEDVAKSFGLQLDVWREDVLHKALIPSAELSLCFDASNSRCSD